MNCGEAQPSRKQVSETVRQSLTALCGGLAAFETHS